MADVDPFVAPIPRKFLEDPETRPFFEYLNRFLHDLFIRTGGGDDAIEAIEEVAAAEADTSRLFSTIRTLERRVMDLEASNDTDALNAKIAKLNQLVNSLIDDLLDAIKANEPDRELENKMLCLQQEVLEQVQLLNARTEEALETDLTEDDL